jgi:hypothetical protein
MTRFGTGIILLATIIGGSAEALAGPPTRVAVFDFELIDTSLEGELLGPQEAETGRLAAVSDQLRRQLAESGRFEIVDIAPRRDAIAAAGYLYGCNGCAAGIAKSLGADFAVTGTVQKVSNLILNINIFMMPADQPSAIRAASVDIRGNTIESWSRGVSYLVRHRLLKDH